MTRREIGVLLFVLCGGVTLYAQDVVGIPAGGSMMKPADCLMVSALVTGIVSAINKNTPVDKRYSLWLAAGLSLCGVLLYGWAFDQLKRELAFNYAVWFGSVFSQAIGIFEVATRSTAAVVNKVKGE